MRIITSIMLLLGLPLAWTTRLDAPLPPEAMDLVPLKGDRQPMDPKLAVWFAEAEKSTDLLQLPNDDFVKLVNSLGPASQSYLRLKKLEGQNRQQWQTSIVKIANEVEKHLDQKHWASDLMLADLLFELLRSADLTESTRAVFSANLVALPARSCPQKRFILSELSRDARKRAPMTVAATKNMLDQVSSFRAKRFQENALQAILGQIEEKNRAELKQYLIELVRPYPRLIADHAWLVEDDDKQARTKELRLQEPLASFDKAEQLASGNQCDNARGLFLQGLNKDKEKKHFDDVQSTLSRIENCFRSRGSRARIGFWTQMKVPLAKVYGLAGEELALRPQGLIFWGQDQFEQARTVFTYLLETSRAQGHKEIEGRTLFTFARIEENEGRLPDAIAKYQAFITNFPEDDKVNESLTSLVVLTSISSQEKQALGFARQLIEQEILKDIRERDASAMSFALFWAGKLSLSLGENLQAYEFWRRVASEFYSTFYGALGHHMLETLLQKRFVVPPNHVAAFDFEAMKTSFSSEDQLILKRIDYFLSLGMQQDAVCETRELDINPDNDMQNLVLSMYLYASGDWLAAIRHFGNLPRTFRHTLPQGMERMLYPRAYSDLVENYTSRLKVEEQIIYAIARQESVFNPRARSPVGASGLMQLMPATARMESRQLSRGYVSGSNRQSLIDRASQPTNLFDAETNIALGVHHVHRLLGRYTHPVFMLTSYNANPRATARWRENIDSTNMLAFIERIPYRETQAYVKLVMRNYFYYTRWYYPANTPMPMMDYLAPHVISIAKTQPLKDEPFVTQ